MFFFPDDGRPDRWPVRPASESTPSVWRWETTVSLVCLLLLPGWMWVTDGSTPNGFWSVVLSVLLGVGIGTGISGARRGDGISTSVAAISVAFQVCVALLFGSLTFMTR